MNADFARLLRAALLAARREGLRGLGSASSRRSDGFEFAEVRAYVVGDDPRRIDWAATARAGDLQTRVVLEDRALALAAIVDASPRMQLGRRRSNYDVGCAAAQVWYSAATDDDRCARIGETAYVLRDVRGRAAARACGAMREPIGGSCERALPLAIASLGRGTRLLIVSDAFALPASLPLLRACANKFDVTALVMRDPWADHLPLRGFTRLRDATSGARARIFIGRRERDRYYRAVAERERSLVATLRRIGARVAIADENHEPAHAFAAAFGLGSFR